MNLIKNNLIAPLILGTLIACSSTNVAKPMPHEVNPNVASKNKPIIGGWAPVFFKTYDAKELNNIIELANTNKVKAINITYTSETINLANQINNTLKLKTKLIPQINQIDVKDTPQTTYTHDTVTVTIYFNKL